MEFNVWMQYLSYNWEMAHFPNPINFKITIKL